MDARWVKAVCIPATSQRDGAVPGERMHFKRWALRREEKHKSGHPRSHVGSRGQAHGKDNQNSDGKTRRFSCPRPPSSPARNPLVVRVSGRPTHCGRWRLRCPLPPSTGQSRQCQLAQAYGKKYDSRVPKAVRTPPPLQDKNIHPNQPNQPNHPKPAQTVSATARHVLPVLSPARHLT